MKASEICFPERLQRGSEGSLFLSVPCVTLREETEWVETVEAGWNTLVGFDPERIVQAALEAHKGTELSWPYGNGRAAERMVECVKELG